MMPRQVLEAIDRNHDRHLQELFEWLRIPSVSTYSEHKADVERAARWLIERTERLGFETELFPTAGHPLVLAERMRHPGGPTLLIYGHFDVQPPEPLDRWESPPFAPEIRDGAIYARGASDDKGQFFTYLAAMEAILETAGELPVNVKILAEGEEEIASTHLRPFLVRHRDRLGADAIAISDTAQYAPGVPAITYGLRGLCYMHVDVDGPRFDLHSGSFGGMVANPVQALAEILARLKTADGMVAIPGFYDAVADIEPREREEMARLAVNEEAVKAYIGVEELTGEPGYSPMERKAARPTLDVNGIWGGFAGEGEKTIIPAQAGAKVSMRLVPHQKQDDIARLFEGFVRSLAPAGVRVSVRATVGADPVLVSRDQDVVRAAARAIATGFGKEPVFIREGGSIPIVNLLQQELGNDRILLLGWGCPDDGAHSPNERFRLEDLRNGTRSAAALLYELAG